MIGDRDNNKLHLLGCRKVQDIIEHKVHKERGETEWSKAIKEKESFGN
jgi:hypothetical protein